MKTRAARAAVGAAMVLLASQVFAQERTPTTSAPAKAKPWSFSATAFGYSVPGGRDYLAPILTADRDWLHLEARYNYENLDTGSLRAGRNFSVGDKLVLEATPMIGAEFGDTDGIVPGYEFSLRYGRFELYSEGEYVFDTQDSSQNFFYTWSELSYSPLDWLGVGVVAQRIKAYQADFDIQRGLLAGFSYERVEVTAYVFNPRADTSVLALSAGVRL